MRKSRIIFGIMGSILLALSVGYSYFAGYQVGRRDTFRDEIAGRMSLNTALYLAVERGDLEKVKSTLGMMVLGNTRTYESVFPTSSRTNAPRMYRFAAEISSQVESNLVVIDHKFVDRINEEIRKERESSRY